MPKRSYKKGEVLKEREKKKSKKQEVVPPTKDSKWVVGAAAVESAQKNNNNNNNKMEDNVEIEETMDTTNSVAAKPATTNPELKDLFALKFTNTITLTENKDKRPLSRKQKAKKAKAITRAINYREQLDNKKVLKSQRHSRKDRWKNLYS
eukprot:TRINITY_DN10962_c0_g1_i1.p1 TRINITY_DN10962_c0_g1~~TRINITY_DN10962_c0_g1_i1.p1  ORF type:complete len:150 (+),score=51.06 TRINITY_DN10962_c0_g1_i1:77-526(+)